MFHPAAGCDATTFQPCSDKALANLKVYVDSFRNGVYTINSGVAPNAAIALGRYFEDVDFGNPWYLTTLAVAEQLYRAVHMWDALDAGIEVTAISLPFFKQFLPSLTGKTTITAGSDDYTTVINSIKNFADGFVAIVAKYTPADGGLSAQFQKDTGAPLSAADLTWSYASALTAFDARANAPVESWGADGLVVPAICGTQGTSTLTFQVRAITQPLGKSSSLSLTHTPHPDVYRRDRIRHWQLGGARRVEPKQGGPSLFVSNRIPPLVGHHHRPCKYEVPVQLHQEARVKNC